MSNSFSESFDNGVGALSHTWGGSIDTSVPGQITVTGNRGAMEAPSGADAGHGYGTYTIVASMIGDHAGPAALLWPADDHWPGSEFDLAEVLNGTAYGTVHYRADGGWDSYDSVWYNGLDFHQPHAYSLDWEPGRITYSIDGHQVGTVTDHVGADFAHGGVNEVFSVMNSDPGTSITVYDVSYTENGAAAAPTSDAAAAALPAESTSASESISAPQEATDWNAIAAQVEANFAATGNWYL